MLLKFEYPLVLLAIPLAIGLLYYFTKPKSIISFCLRCVIIILLGLVLAGFRIKAPPQNLCRIYLIDDSASIFLDKDRLLASINENIKQVGRGDLTRILYLNPTDDKTVTNIEKGLLSAKASFPSGYRKEIFLFSDGNETAGDVKNAIPYLKQEGIALYTIPIGPKEVVDIKIDSVDAPKFVRAGQPIELKCRLSSTINTTAGIKILGNGELIKRLDGISLLKNQDNLIVITLPTQSEPVLTYRVIVSVQGLNEIAMENNSGIVVVQKVGKPKIAYVSEAENLSLRTIPLIIKSNNDFDIQVIKLPTFITSLDDFVLKVGGEIPFDRLYDVIILDDVSLAKKGNYENIQSSMKSFAANGGGLLVVGGQNSFGLGNYQNSELEKILPVYASPPEDLAVVMILDASGSMDEFPDVMAGNTKFVEAAKALWDSVSLLSKIDRLEVMVFNQGYETILPLQSADNIISKLKERILKVKPTGPTAILPPLQKAMATLSSVSSAKKHIILLSDGHSTTNELPDGFKQIADKLGQNNITISVIATGEHINEETLKALTGNETNGKIYRLKGKGRDELASNLKQDLSVNKEFYRASKDLPVNIHIKDDVLKGIDNIPPISGYNRTTLKPNARLVASVGDKEPLMADWQYGLGKVMVLATSLDSHWMGSWNKWEGLGQMVTQALRYLTADIDQNRLSDISTDVLADGRIKLLVESPDNLQLDAQVDPQGYLQGHPQGHPVGESLSAGVTDTKTIRLAQVAAGRYEAILPAQKEGGVISVFSQKEGSKQLLGRVPVVAQYAREWRRFTPDMGLLRNLAESTGGKLLTADEFTKGDTLSAVNGKSEPTYRNINAILILAALGIFLMDLLIRR